MERDRMESTRNSQSTFQFRDNKQGCKEGNGMSRIRTACRSVTISVLACLAGIAGMQTAFGDQNPSSCAPASDVGIAVFCVQNGVTNAVTGGQTLVVGETVLYQGRVFQNDNGNCGFQGGQINIITPDNVSHNATMGQTIPLICGSSGCNPAGVALFTSQFVPYTVAAADVGTSRLGVFPCNPSPAGRVQAVARYVGGISHCDAGDDCDPSAAVSICNLVLVRGLGATKLAACTTSNACGAGASYSSSVSGAKSGSTNPSFCYSITITNKGTTPLVITNVSDDVLGNLTASFPGGLAPGGGATAFIGPQAESTTTINHVTVLGFELTSCQHLSVNATATATATVLPAAIAVTKVCDGGPFVIGQPIKFKGTVSNNGSVTLTGVNVVDNRAGTVLSGVTLAPGASTNYSGSYAPTGNLCGPFTNAVVATGTESLCPGNSIQ